MSIIFYVETNKYSYSYSYSYTDIVVGWRKIRLAFHVLYNVDRLLKKSCLQIFNYFFLLFVCKITIFKQRIHENTKDPILGCKTWLIH
jgi:hypothetical protein